MHVTQQPPKGHIVHQVNDVTIRLTLGRVIVKHKEHAGESEDNKKVKSDSAHPPGVAVADRVAVDLGGMEVEKDVGEHAQRSAALALIVLHPEHRFVERSLLWLLERLDVFLRLV